MIEYKKGDVLNAESQQDIYIIHICNDRGGWGAGFVSNLSKKWKTPEKCYRQSFSYKMNNKLGDIQTVVVEPKTTEHGVIRVTNMICQKGFYSPSNPIPLDYNYLKLCLAKLIDQIKNNKNNCEIHCPKIGTGLAKGDWNVISEMLEETSQITDSPIFVYEL